jgi:hypothetical protein
MAIELTLRYGVDKTTKSFNSVKLHLFPDIWHWNLWDVTDNVLSIIKVQEYRFHVLIYHIFWEQQVAELPKCIETGKMEKIAGTGPGFRIRYGGTLDTVKSVVRAIPSITETPNAFRTFTKYQRTLPSRMTILHCLRQCSVFVRQDLGKVGNPQNHWRQWCCF